MDRLSRFHGFPGWFTRLSMIDRSPGPFSALPADMKALIQYFIETQKRTREYIRHAGGPFRELAQIEFKWINTTARRILQDGYRQCLDPDRLSTTFPIKYLRYLAVNAVYDRHYLRMIWARIRILMQRLVMKTRLRQMNDLIEEQARSSSDSDDEAFPSVTFLG